MGETLPIFSTNFNGSVQIKAREDHLSADIGAVLRKIMERTRPNAGRSTYNALVSPNGRHQRVNRSSYVYQTHQSPPILKANHSSLVGSAFRLQ